MTDKLRSVISNRHPRNSSGIGIDGSDILSE